MTTPDPAHSVAGTIAKERGAWDLTASDLVAATGAGLRNARDYLSILRSRSRDLAGYGTLSASVEDLPDMLSDGPLAGVAVVVKDNIDVAGLPTSGGTPALAGHTASSDAPLIERLVSAGAVITAKNTMHELALGATSNNAFQGVPHNPWDPARICGGSSGGTAGAVALGLAPIGIGTDTGGSVRMPAALCGVFGFRPSPGRYPAGGMLSLSPTRDVAGPLTRSMQDILLVDSVLTSRPGVSASPATAGIRLGISPCHLRDLHPDVARGFNEARQILAGLGVQFMDVGIDDIVEDAAAVATTILWGEAERSLEDYLVRIGGPSLQQLVRDIASPDVRKLVLSNFGSVSPATYSAAIETREHLRAELLRRFQTAGVQALIFPTVPVVAPLIAEEDLMELNGRPVQVFPTLIRHTDLGGVLGLPGISIPVGRGYRTGLPIGLEFSSPPNTDDQLLAVTAALEPLISHTTKPSQLINASPHSPLPRSS